MKLDGTYINDDKTFRRLMSLPHGVALAWVKDWGFQPDNENDEYLWLNKGYVVGKGQGPDYSDLAIYLHDGRYWLYQRNA